MAANAMSREDRNVALYKLKGGMWARACENYARWKAGHEDGTVGSVGELYGKCEAERPILLLGPGISLELVLPMLPSLYRPMTLMACNSALNPLVARGVIPQVVVAYDATDDIAKQFKEYVGFAPAEQVKDSILICPNTISPKVLAEWPAKSFWFAQWEATTPQTETLFTTLAQQYGKITRFENLSCVFNFMLCLAHRLGSRLVFSAGFDLPVTPEYGYSAVRWDLSTNPPKPIADQIREIDWKITVMHRGYVCTMLDTVNTLGVNYINLSPVASFKDFVITLPPHALMTGTMRLPEGVKIDGAE